MIFPKCDMWDQQRLRPACTCAQSDQTLCWSLGYFKNTKLLSEHQLKFQRLTGCRTGSSESTLVKMPLCWKSYVMALLCCFFRLIVLTFALLFSD